MGNTNNNGTPNQNNPNNNQNNGYFSFLSRKKTNNNNDENEWDQFMNQNIDTTQRIYSNTNQVLMDFDGKKAAEDVKIVEKKYSKTKFHFWLEDESLSCTYKIQNNILEVSALIKVKCKNPELFTNNPAILSIFLFGKEEQDVKSNIFQGIKHGKFFESFAHFNHGNITDNNISEIQLKNSMYLYFI